jgi:hypothetical protein
MPKVIGGILAIVALGASMLAGVDPATTMLRGALAFTLGVIATQVWYICFTVRVSTMRELATPASGDAGGAPTDATEELARAA